MKKGKLISLEAGQTLFIVGDLDLKVYMVLYGILEITKPSDNEVNSSSDKYYIGSYVGEEWIFFKAYTERQDNCLA